MKEEYTRALLVVIVFGGFFALMLAVLLGAVSVQSPEVAKLVGMIFGYLTGIMSPIIVRYFKNGETP
jgi:ABC-type dipeptide/oligopeptide/nickel transport system permease subunit